MLDLDYALFDLAGNIKTITDTGGTGRDRSYVYDELHRLTDASGGIPTESYSYDEVGNRTARTVGAAAESYAYDAASNRLLSVTGAATRSLTYSDSGNTAQDDKGGGTVLDYAYDSADRLVAVTQGAATVADYLHNAMGQRVAKTVGGATTQFLYDLSGRLVAEADGATGAATAEYVWLEGIPLAFVQGGAVYYIHADHLGTPQRLTDATKAVVWDASYAPFGEATVSGSVTFNLRFPGQYEDAETGLHYNYFRDYDPALGRYVQSDPIGLAGGWNTFAYVGGNPVMAVDPEGLAAEPGTGGTIGGCIFDCTVQHYFGVSARQITELSVYFLAVPIYKPWIGFNPRALGSPSAFTNPLSLIGHYLPGAKFKPGLFGTTRLFRIVGRVNVVTAWIFLAYDVYAITDCVVDCYRCANPSK